MFFVAASLCAALAPIRPASAQTEMSLRASYQGNLLPEGTEIIVLSKEGRVQREGRYQPEFFSTREFPRSGPGVLLRDRLGATGRSARRFTPSQESGRLYFIYALTPDSTLYWSYSALRDSLKYDVANTGVMSVAPIPAPDIRDAVLATFFRPRVTVVMREEDGDGVRGPRIAAADKEKLSMNGAAGFALMHSPTSGSALSRVVVNASGAASDATDSAPDAASSPAELTASSSVSSETPASVATSPTRLVSQSAASPEENEARSGSSGVTLSPLLAWSLLIFLLAIAAVPAYLAHSYRAELKRVRREMLTLRAGMASSYMAAERHSRTPTGRRTLVLDDESTRKRRRLVIDDEISGTPPPPESEDDVRSGNEDALPHDVSVDGVQIILPLAEMPSGGRYAPLVDRPHDEPANTQSSSPADVPESGRRAEPRDFEATGDGSMRGGDAADSHYDLVELQSAIEDAKRRFEQLEDDHEILQARYASLEKDKES